MTFRYHRRKHTYAVGVRGEGEPRAWVVTTSAARAVKEAERSITGCTLDVLNRLP